MEQTIKTQVYRVFKTFFFTLTLALALVAIVGWIAVVEKSPFLGAVGGMMALFLPIIFMSKIKALFTMEASIIFDEDNVTIVTFHAGGEEIMKPISFKWENIRSYKIYNSVRGDLTLLDLDFRDGKFKEFVFKEGQTSNESLNTGEPNLSQAFRSNVKAYNRQVEKGAQISLSPGFLTTKLGKFWLIIIGILLMVAFVLMLVIKRSSAAFLLIGLAAYLPLLAKRRRDLVLYRKISELDSAE